MSAVARTPYQMGCFYYKGLRLLRRYSYLTGRTHEASIQSENPLRGWDVRSKLLLVCLALVLLLLLSTAYAGKALALVSAPTPMPIPSPASSAASAYDYFPIEPGHYIMYNMSDGEPHRLYDCKVEVVSQCSKEGVFFTTLTKLGPSGGYFRESAIFGSERDERLIYWDGAPVGNQNHTLDVTITGTNLTGASAVSFGNGIAINRFTVEEAPPSSGSLCFGLGSNCFGSHCHRSYSLHSEVEKSRCPLSTGEIKGGAIFSGCERSLYSSSSHQQT